MQEMHRVSIVALSLALLVSSGFGLSLSSAWADTKGQSIKAHPTAVPIPRAKPKVVQANERNVTSDLNRQSLRNAQKEVMTADAKPAEVNAAPASQDETPLIRRLPPTLERFSNSGKITQKGWTSTLGLLPVPDTKISSIPSPDVRCRNEVSVSVRYIGFSWLV
jgi:hypothetical protein